MGYKEEMLGIWRRGCPGSGKDGLWSRKQRKEERDNVNSMPETYTCPGESLSRPLNPETFCLSIIALLPCPCSDAFSPLPDILFCFLNSFVGKRVEPPIA